VNTGELREYGMTMWNCGRRVAFGALLALSAPICIHSADAAESSSRSYAVAANASARAIQAGAASYANQGWGRPAIRYGRIGGGLQCVPFARENSGIELTGNAVNWWNKAVGIYERGSRPEVGSVLNFRANGRMSLGHVAVVSRVIDGRNVEIDHANWASRGAVNRNINVVDVSPQNDWTAVRVALGQSGDFGSVYPTYGFIYDRPDHGTMVANVGITPAPVLNSAPSDLRPANERILAGLGSEPDEEVAEASDDGQPPMRQASYARMKLAKAFHATMVHGASASSVPSTTRVVHRRRGHHST